MKTFHIFTPIGVLYGQLAMYSLQEGRYLALLAIYFTLSSCYVEKLNLISSYAAQYLV
jgi:hypothetical protein